MKKIYVIVFSLLIGFTEVFPQETFDNVEDLYARVLGYYELAQEEHENGEYIKSYEYSQLANGLFSGSSEEVYIQLATLMLNDLERRVSEAIENLNGGDGVDNYDSIVNSYNAGKELHDKFNNLSANDDFTLVQSTFEDARDYYRHAASMLENNHGVVTTPADEDINKNTQSPQNTEGSQTSIDEANTKYLYLTRNNIITSTHSSYKSLNDNINRMNQENSTTLANENIKAMDTLILDNDIKKMFNYADKSTTKAKSMGSSVTGSDSYKNILARIETAKTQYADGDNKNAAQNIATALLEMESELAILKKLPQTYTVVQRENIKITDSFWRISGYDFVYADREKWPTLYDANQNKVIHEGDPRFIEPGTIFNIRSLVDEPREGHYNSRELYIPITVYYYLDVYSATDNNANTSSYDDDNRSSNLSEEQANSSNAETSSEADDDVSSSTENDTDGSSSSLEDNNIEGSNASADSDDDGVLNVIDEDDASPQYDGFNSSSISVQSFSSSEKD